MATLIPGATEETYRIKFGARMSDEAMLRVTRGSTGVISSIEMCDYGDNVYIDLPTSKDELLGFGQAIQDLASQLYCKEQKLTYPPGVR